ncbi:MAG TPA: hypothetical protein VF942_10575, partial [Acidimicrobiales bacterium]
MSKVLALVIAALLLAGIARIGLGSSESVITSGHGHRNSGAAGQAGQSSLGPSAGSPLVPQDISPTTTMPTTTAPTTTPSSARTAGSSATNPRPLATPPPQHPPIVTSGKFDHIFVIMEENQDYSQVIGSPSAPTINALASANANATNYHGVIHPSVNNYLGFVSGQTYSNITDSCTPGGTCSTSAPNLADQVEARGRTWKGYFEDMPSPG